MAIADYIPAGCTSRSMHGSIELQVQTEYAIRPTPRLTTTVLSSGQVIHKIEKDLPAPIKDLDDKARVEILLRRQHLQVLEVVKGEGFSSLLRERFPDEFAPAGPPSLVDRLKSIDGVLRIYPVSNDGSFGGCELSNDFKKRFGVIFKNLRDILEVFTELPAGRREQGVYEVERDRLYLISCGNECYFVLMSPSEARIDFEAALEEILI
ncbi:MAG: hypothetical protein JSV44_09075 [Candidatus Zixiibacteriota bacterium]|nr:MAG: hypothetical protein JSV44_09075 [candidate division Zixibacteria bacterium]